MQLRERERKRKREKESRLRDSSSPCTAAALWREVDGLACGSPFPSGSL